MEELRASSATTEVVLSGGRLQIGPGNSRVARIGFAGDTVDWSSAECCLGFEVTATTEQIIADFSNGVEKRPVTVGKRHVAAFETVGKSLGQGLTRTYEEAVAFRQLRLEAREFGIQLDGDGITHDGHGGPLAGAEATVQTGGEIQSRYTATRIALMGPFALAFKKKKDKRELYLAIDAPSYSILVEVDKNRSKSARQLAANLNTASRSIAQPPNEKVAPSAPISPSQPLSVGDELAKLAQLKDAGYLTPAEFDEQKRRLLE